MAEVRLDNISKFYTGREGRLRAVDDLSLAVADRELVVLVGPSGCGKTTTLRLIAGLEEIDAGTLRIGNRIVNEVAPRDRDIAMVFQNYALYPHMTVFRNMAFGLKMRKVPRGQIRNKVEATARILGLTDLLSRKPSALSGGECQRVALGRAIVRSPQLFLFDEPLSNLDAELRQKMRTEIKRLQRELQTTAIYVTHDQEEAMTLGDRIAVMRAGVMQQCAPPLDVYSRPANRFVAGFIGTPPMNFISVAPKHDGTRVRFRVDHTDHAIDPPADVATKMTEDGLQEAVLGIRPEHVTLASPDAADHPDGMIRLTDGRVTVLEPLGNTVNVHLVAEDSSPLIARAAPEAAPKADERYAVWFNPAQAHWFTADGQGRRLN